MWEGLTDQLSHGKGFVEQLNWMNGGIDGVGDVNETLANMGSDYYTAWVGLVGGMEEAAKGHRLPRTATHPATTLYARYAAVHAHTHI